MTRTVKLVLVNSISALRLLMAIEVLTLVAQGHWVPAACFLLLGLASDQLDGYMARKWQVATKFGYHLDGQSDRILLISPLIGMMIAGDLLLVVGVVLIIGVWVADALADSFELMRGVWWPIIYVTIVWGLVTHVEAAVSLALLAVAIAAGAGVIWLKRDQAAKIWHDLRRRNLTT